MSLELISSAYAEGGAAQASPISSIIMLVGFVVIFYFLLIRPQQKRAKEHKNLIGNLQKGSEVALAGGVMGRITKVKDDFCVLEISNGVEITVQKQAITAELPKGTLKAVEND